MHFGIFEAHKTAHIKSSSFRKRPLNRSIRGHGHWTTFLVCAERTYCTKLNAKILCLGHCNISANLFDFLFSMFYLMQHCSCDITDSSFVSLLLCSSLELTSMDTRTDLVQWNCSQSECCCCCTLMMQTVFADSSSEHGLFYEVGSVIETIDICIKL